MILDNSGFGAGFSGVPTQYVESHGEFIVPSHGNDSGQLAVWAGLDGFNYRALIQNGVWLHTDRTTTLYYEYLQYDNSGNSVGNALFGNFNPPVQAGDDLGVWNYPCTPSFPLGGSLNVNGGYACFYFFDYTQHISGVTVVHAQPPPFVQFAGHTAEFIAERPTGVTSFCPTTPLTNYGAFLSVPATAWDDAGYTHTSSTDAWIQANLRGTQPTNPPQLESMGFVYGVYLGFQFLAAQ